MIHLFNFSSPCSHASSAPSFPLCLPSCVFFAWRQALSPLLPSCSPPSLYGCLWLLQSTRPSLYAACRPGHGLWSPLARFSLGLNVIANVPAWSLQLCVCVRDCVCVRLCSGFLRLHSATVIVNITYCQRRVACTQCLLFNPLAFHNHPPSPSFFSFSLLQG